MIEKVDHVGIAVQDLDRAVEVYRDVLGLDFVGFEDVADQKVRVAIFKAGDDTIELVAPSAADSPINRFLKNRGDGMHHMCLKVDDIEATLARFKQEGMQLIDELPRPGAHGCRIAFIHPKSTGGVLIELSEQN